MLKILIADDEPLVRAGIKSVIPWQQHGFEVIGEAENGLEAYNKIISLKPDILITDIKMPQMDGIELLKKIKKDKIHIQSIILSCFDEFDMVREAMKYGAKDYILKLSIEPQKILDVLDEIKQNMAVDEPQSDQIVLDDSDIKYLFIRKLINHGFTSEEQVNNVIHNIHFSASLNHYKLTMFDDNKLLYNLLDQICQRFKGHELILIKTNRYLLVQNDENNEFLYRQISASINQFANGTVLFGQSSFFDSYTDFSIAQQQALSALKTCMFYQEDSILSYEQILNNSVLQISRENEKTLHIALSSRDADKSINEITSLLRVVTNAKYPLEQIQSYLDELLSIYISVSRENNFSVKHLFQNYLDKINDISLFHSFSDCKNSFVDFTNDFINYLYSIAPHEGYEIVKIKEYVQLHYMENIDLNLISELVNITPSHLSNLFKKETGENFTTYLTRIRMNEAHRLLLQPDTLIYEVAEKTGYANSSYFGKAFRKYYGMSPEEFKVQNLNRPSENSDMSPYKTNSQ